MSNPRILIIPGSLRTGSHNARLAALAAKELALLETEVTRISLEDYTLPLFDADLVSAQGLPAAAVALKHMLLAHQGVFMLRRARHPRASRGTARRTGLRRHGQSQG
ncbi:MAG: NAD(P)H-dependent oxidoreductase [Xanthobacteraceae bacterium]